MGTSRTGEALSLHTAQYRKDPEADAALPSSSERAATKEQQERLKLLGRLGANPQYQTFDNGNSRIRFSLGEHLDDGTTSWHRVYSTNRFAERIHAKGLKRGDLVEVAGTRQERTEKTRDGQEKVVPYIYAFGVKLR
jgi:hypothetical protein